MHNRLCIAFLEDSGILNSWIARRSAFGDLNLRTPPAPANCFPPALQKTSMPARQGITSRFLSLLVAALLITVTARAPFSCGTSQGADAVPGSHDVTFESD